MIELIGKTIKNVEMNKGVLCFTFEDGSVGAVNTYLSTDLSKECREEICRSFAERKSHLFTILRDKF